jgi:GNAT superfamily N-acetyltransferase
MLDNSLTLGLYKQKSASPDDMSTAIPIGFARLVTDHVTFAYLTDVFVLDESRKLGLGKWLIQCCREFLAAMPDLRWTLLFTASERIAQMYQRELGMQQIGKTDNGLFSLGARGSDIRAVVEDIQCTSKKNGGDSG